MRNSPPCLVNLVWNDLFRLCIPCCIDNAAQIARSLARSYKTCQHVDSFLFVAGVPLSPNYGAQQLQAVALAQQS